MDDYYDVAIVGSGFGGSLMAMVVRRLGLSVLLIERGKHPRFAIGESTSPLTNLLLEQIAERYDLPRLIPLTSYGPWQRTYPEVVCGLKRGFTFFHHEAGQPYRMAADRGNQLMVAANPNDELGDTHWLRSDVDAFLVREAADIGVDYYDQAALDQPQRNGDGATLTGRHGGQPFQTQARLVVDATGPRGFLSKVLDIPEDPFSDYPKTQTLYSHFTGVRRCDSMAAFQPEGIPPYPLDDAALHHVFDGGWMWVLRFGNGVTSAGVAVTDAVAESLALSDGEPAWHRFLERYPSIGEQFADAKAIMPFVYAPRLAYRAAKSAGPGWVMLPSAAAFIDPLFSTGIPLTLLGIERLGRILSESWSSGDLDARLQEYSRVTRFESDATADLISGSYAGMRDFPLFAALSMFYFTAASFSEMARRLNPSLVRRYLVADHPEFGAGMRRCAEMLRRRLNGTATMTGAGSFFADVADATSCLNVAGLSDTRKQNWYGVDLADVIDSAAKLGFTRLEMRRVLEEAPWAAGCPLPSV